MVNHFISAGQFDHIPTRLRRVLAQVLAALLFDDFRWRRWSLQGGTNRSTCILLDRPFVKVQRVEPYKSQPLCCHLPPEIARTGTLPGTASQSTFSGEAIEKPTVCDLSGMTLPS